MQKSVQPRLNQDRHLNFESDDLPQMRAIKQAIARAEAETQATLAAQTRAAWETHARARALEKEKVEHEARLALEGHARADEEAAIAAGALIATEQAIGETIQARRCA